MLDLVIMDNWSNVYLIAQSSANNSGGINPLHVFFVIIGVIFVIGSYIFSSYCFEKIYEKLGQPNSWFAWVPILNIWIMYKAGDQSPWWIIGLFIPLINIVPTVILLIAFVKIVNKINKSAWLLTLMTVPLVNFWVLYHLAF